MLFKHSYNTNKVSESFLRFSIYIYIYVCVIYTHTHTHTHILKNNLGLFSSKGNKVKLKAPRESGNILINLAIHLSDILKLTKKYAIYSPKKKFLFLFRYWVISQKILSH